MVGGSTTLANGDERVRAIKKRLVSHDGTMRVPRCREGCEKRPRATFKVKLTE
jgi:hypothetical protein